MMLDNLTPRNHGIAFRADGILNGKQRGGLEAVCLSVGCTSVELISWWVQLRQFYRVLKRGNSLSPEILGTYCLNTVCIQNSVFPNFIQVKVSGNPKLYNKFFSFAKQNQLSLQQTQSYINRIICFVSKVNSQIR